METKVNFQLTVEYGLALEDQALKQLLLLVTGDLRKVFLKNSQYCTKKMINQKQAYVHTTRFSAKIWKQFGDPEMLLHLKPI